jgi:hypothetical protein
MKFCKDCKHFNRWGNLCGNPEFVELSIITGRPHYTSAHDMRYLPLKCGEEAKGWEERACVLHRIPTPTTMAVAITITTLTCASLFAWYYK